MAKKDRLKKISAVGVAVICALAPVLMRSAYAKIPESQLYSYGINGIYFYDSTASSCLGIAVGGYDGNATAGLSDLQAAFVDNYHGIAEALSIEYGIPWETVVAQGILESASGTSNFAKNRNNFFGIGAFDSNPNNAFSYATPEEGWRGYYENIRKTSVYRSNGVFAGETITNPYAYAQAIKNAGYASDPTYVEKLSSLIKAIENRAGEKGWALSAELAQKHPEMVNNAGENSAGESGGSSYNAGAVCASAGNGDINATAISLSWPDRSHAANDPKPEYKEALNMPGGVATLGQGDSCSIGGNSCDAFLATVMRYSNADAEFPCCGAAMQLDYLSSHSDKYEEIQNIGNTSNLQPGDIRASGGHVEIVVQMDNGAYKIASASHCDRTGDHGSDYYPGLNFRVFRRKQ